MQYQAMGKSELAHRFGVSLSTLRRWLQRDNIIDELGITKEQFQRLQIFSPIQVRMICERYEGSGTRQ